MFGIVVNGFPAGHAGEECVHEDELRHFGRELRGVSVGDHEADVVANDFRFLHAERLGEIVDADCGAFHVEAVGGNVGIADAGQIRRDNGEALGERGE